MIRKNSPKSLRQFVLEWLENREAGKRILCEMVEAYSVDRTIDALGRYAKLTKLHATILLRQAGVVVPQVRTARDLSGDPTLNFDKRARRLWVEDAARLVYLVALWRAESRPARKRAETAEARI